MEKKRRAKTVIVYWLVIFVRCILGVPYIFIRRFFEIIENICGKFLIVLDKFEEWLFKTFPIPKI